MARDAITQPLLVHAMGKFKVDKNVLERVRYAANLRHPKALKVLVKLKLIETDEEQKKGVKKFGLDSRVTKEQWDAMDVSSLDDPSLPPELAPGSVHPVAGDFVRPVAGDSVQADAAGSVHAADSLASAPASSLPTGAGNTVQAEASIAQSVHVANDVPLDSNLPKDLQALLASSSFKDADEAAVYYKGLYERLLIHYRYKAGPGR